MHNDVSSSVDVIDGDNRTLAYAENSFFANEIVSKYVVGDTPVIARKVRQLKPPPPPKYMLTEEERNELLEFVDVGHLNLTEQKPIEEDENEYPEWTCDLLHLQNNVYYLDLSKENDQLFNKFFDALNDSTDVGLAAFGIDICRATGFKYIAFSIVDYGCFVIPWNYEAQQLLKDVLESTNVRKIVYNCMGLSDALLNKYNIRLDGVTDVAAFDCVIIKQNSPDTRKSYPETFRSLVDLIEDYIGIDVARNCFKNFGTAEEFKCVNDDLTVVAKNFVRRECGCLIDLFEAQNEFFYREVIAANQAMLNIQRNCPDKHYLVYVKEKNSSTALNNHKTKFIRRDSIEAAIRAAACTTDYSSESISQCSDSETSTCSPQKQDVSARISTALCSNFRDMLLSNGYDESNNTEVLPLQSSPKLSYSVGGHEHHYNPNDSGRFCNFASQVV